MTDMSQFTATPTVEELEPEIERLEAEIERLRAVVDAVKDIKWRSIDKDNMEFATTCFVVDKIRNALAALEETKGVLDRDE